MTPTILTRFQSLIIALILATICLIVYHQGLNGPFIFDDSENIESNSALRITQLDLDSISTSALSGRAGPLKRPVAMLSFALNYYFSGNNLAFSFKLTNVTTQAFCAFLFFVFLLHLLRLTSVQQTTSIKEKSLHWIAFSVAAIWAAHPINLTSVLYIVQRMTSLSTLFTLACLIFYIKARNTSAESPRASTTIIMYLASFISFILAIFSKENALLIPAYILLIEWVFFPKRSPWSFFSALQPNKQRLIQGILFLICTIVLIAAIDHASQGYGSRSFTLVERVLTESRVICFYIFLIILPRINAFGLFHDDIPLSSSLIDPWTTLLSIVTIAVLIIFAIRYKKTKPLVSFGVLFFFCGHLLESTIFGLEIAHEHRNHLPSMGVIIALTGFFIHQPSFNKRIFVLSVSAVFMTLFATTMLRAHEWQDEYSLAVYEAEHHPESPATLGLLSSAAFKRKEYALSEITIKKAKDLAPTESAYAINSLLLTSILGKPIEEKLTEEINAKLRQNALSPSTQIALAHISTHLTSKGFIPLQPYFIEWLNIISEKLGNTRQASIYHYFLAKAYLATGDTLKAINAHQQAFHLDKKFINPLFEIGNIFLALKQAGNARFILKEIEKANKNPALLRHYDRHIDELNAAIIQIEKANEK